MPTAYNPAAEGPSAAEQMRVLKARNDITRTGLTEDYNKSMFQSSNLYENVNKPALQSGLGASGQAYGTAGDKAQAQQATAFQYEQYGIESQFRRAKDDLARQQAFASIGLVL